MPALTEKLNQAYRTSLFEDLRRAADVAPSYTEALSVAARHEPPAEGKRFRDEENLARDARDLLRQWRRLQRINAEAASVPISEVRRVLTDTRSLAKASHELKYRYLIIRLLRED